MPQNQAERVGNLSMSYCTRKVVNVGAMKKHKCIRVNCRKTCNLDIHSREFSKTCNLDIHASRSHAFVNRQRSLSDLVKTELWSRRQLLDVGNDFLGYLIANQMAITAKYLPISLNDQVDSPSINHLCESSDWKYDPKFLQQIFKLWGAPQIHIFASPLNNQLSKFMS